MTNRTVVYLKDLRGFEQKDSRAFGTDFWDRDRLRIVACISHRLLGTRAFELSRDVCCSAGDLFEAGAKIPSL